MCSSTFKTSESDGKDQQEISCGTYSRVYGVNYVGKTCAAKEMQSNIYSNLVSTVGQEKIKEVMFKTCTQYSKLCHPNIIQFLGIYNPRSTSTGNSCPATCLHLWIAIKTFLSISSILLYMMYPLPS